MSGLTGRAVFPCPADADRGVGPHEPPAPPRFALIFDAHQGLDHPQALVELPDGTPRGAAGLLESVMAWLRGPAERQPALVQVLDALNNRTPEPPGHRNACAPAH